MCGYNDGCNGVNEGYYTENDKNVEQYGFMFEYNAIPLQIAPIACSLTPK